MRKNNLYFTPYILAIFFLCASCSSETDGILQITYSDLEYLSILSSTDMNGKWPVALALVRSDDPYIINELSKLSAVDWFNKEQEFRNDYPDLVIDTWEIVPGQVLNDQYVGEGYELAGFFFARYHNTTANRLRLIISGDALLKLEKDSFSLEPVNGGSSSWFWFW